jgi:hypothetical protein
MSVSFFGIGQKGIAMAVTAEAKIMEALFGRLAALVLTPVLPIAWPNLTLTPPTTGKFLRVQFIPNIANRVFIGSDEPHQLMGLFQVSVCWPLNAGEGAPRDIAGTVAGQFPADLRLDVGGLSVRVTKRPDVDDLLIEDSRVQIPVTIEWECWG